MCDANYRINVDVLFFRKKLLQSLNPNKRQLRMWDPELIAMKQRALVSQVYGKL